MDKHRALQNLRPGAQFTVRDDVVEWNDAEQTCPTDAELQVELERLVVQDALDRVKYRRAKDYATEADPLFFKAQRGEATMDEWNAKVAEIRARYPYGGE